MACHGLTAADDYTAVIDRYLTDLDAHLRGPRRARARVLAEVRDGLTEAIDAHRANGRPPDAVAAAAIAEFGDPETIARSFTPELVTATARCIIAALIVTGPIIGIWWLLLLHPAPWRTGIVAMLIAVPALPLIALAIGTAVGTFATTGRLMRWLPETTAARATNAATVVATLCLAGDLTVLGVLAAHVATGSTQPHPLAVVAVTASVLRILATVIATRTSRAMSRWLRPA